MATFLGIVSITPRVGISTTSISTGRSSTTALITASVTGQNLGGSYTYLWKQSGNTCTINTPNLISTTITGGGVAGFTDIFCEITYSTTKIMTRTPVCQIIWTNTGIAITSVTWSISSPSTSVYTGLPQSVTLVSVTPTAATYSLSTTTATNATNQAFTTLVGTGSYSGTFTSPILTIIPQTLSIASSGPVSFVYNGVAQSVGYVVSGNVLQDTNWSVTGATETNAGSYTAALSTTSPNYVLGIGTSSFSWNIQPSTISIASSGPVIFTYSGLSQSVGYNVTGVFPEDTNWSVSGISGTNTGSYTATLTESSSNYVFGIASSFPWVINPATITIASSGSTTFTYSGQSQSVGYSVIGVVPQDSSYNVVGVSGTNAGDYTATLSETSLNYVLGTPNTFSWSIGARELTIASSGPTTFTYSGQSQSVGYTISGAVPEDTSYNVVGTSATNAGSYTATLSETSSNYTLGTPSTFTWTIDGVAPGPPPIGSVSSGDKSFTINWSAPVDDGGSPITGYYVQNSTNNGVSWSTATLVSVSTSYTWSGNAIIYNGNSYIGRVAAVNSVDTGSYSENSASAVPTFAAPSIDNIFGSSGYPTPSAQGLRPFNITYTPTSCVNYSSTYIYIRYDLYESFGSYFASVNGAYDNLFTTTTGQQTTGNINSIYAQNLFIGANWYDSTPEQSFSVYAVTYNNDGYGVASATYNSFITSPYTYGLPSGPFLTTSYSAATGTIVVTGNSFSQIPAYSIPNNTTQITSLSIEAWVNITGINICSNGRNFTVWFSGSSTTIPNPTGVSNNCNSAPFNNNSGTTHQFKSWNVADTGYQVQGAGRLRINGGGTIGTWATSPDNRIRVIININGTELLLY